MVVRRPLVLASGLLSELPPGDTTVGGAVGTLTAGSGLSGGGDLSSNQRVDVSLAPNPSGLIFVGDALGLDGAAAASGNAALSLGSTALASGNAGLSLASTALASGNAALARTLIQTAVNLSGGVTGAVPYQSGVGTTAFLSPGVSGQVLATQGASLAPTWITPGGGKVLQVVQGVSDVADGTNSSTFVATSLTASITPSSTSSKVLAIVTCPNLYQSSNSTGYYTLYRSTSTNLSTSVYGFLTNYLGIGGQTNGAIVCLDSPATTSSTAYTVYQRSQTGVSYFNSNPNFGGGTRAVITLLEIGP